MKRYSALLLGLSLVLFFSIALRGEEETKYTNESFARLSYVSGSVTIQRAPDAKPEEGVLNAPLEDGNSVATAEGRAEIYFGKSNYVRLDNNSRLEIVTLPKKDMNIVRLRIPKGSAYFSIFNLDREKSIEVHTADASFYVLGDGLYRVDVRENKKTEMLVFQGAIEAAGEEGSQLLKSEQSIEASQGKFSTKPRRFYAVAEDGFDRWNQSRDSKVIASVAKAGNLPEELKDFEGELSENGNWVYVRPYGWVWAPSNVDENWRPYYNGSWVDLSVGWSWLPYEPWGWAPFHYGRWGWGVGIGWYWIPTSIWGPAWVSWWWGYDYWAWAPMSWWGYPGVLYGGIYYDHWNGYYPAHSRALTVVHKDQLRARNISQAALNPSSAKGLDKMNLTAQAPAVRPAGNTVSRSLAAEGRVFPRRETQGGTGRLAGTDSRLGSSSLRGAERSGQINRGGLTGSTQNGSRQGRVGTGTLSRPQGTVTRGASRRTQFGYPSSPNISVGRSGTGSSWSNSIRSRFYDSLQRNGISSRGSSYARGSNSSRGSTSSRSRGSISSGSRGSSSGSRGSVSSGSRGPSSSGSRGGSVSRGSAGGGGRGRH